MLLIPIRNDNTIVLYRWWVAAQRETCYAEHHSCYRKYFIEEFCKPNQTAYMTTDNFHRVEDYLTELNLYQSASRSRKSIG
jgi:hypothetical protein